MRRSRVLLWSGLAAALIALAAAGLGWWRADQASAACPAAPPPPASATTPAAAASGPELLRPVVVARHPHDPDAFTQGLAYAGGDQLYEGTGLEGRSQTRRVDVSSGDVLVERDLPGDQFGEGLALARGKVVQLTWQDGVGYVRGRCGLEEVGEFAYAGEGWGLASDGSTLWRSDGTEVLRALDPETFAVLREVRVEDRGVPVQRLNELEVVDGALLANVWQTTWVVRIDPTTGRVTGWLDASALAAEVAGDIDGDPDAVLNGIAWDPGGDRLWLTGKLWPTLFEVRLEAAGGPLPPPGLTG